MQIDDNIDKYEGEVHFMCLMLKWLFVLQALRNCSTRSLQFKGHPTIIGRSMPYWCLAPGPVGQLAAICWKFILKVLEPNLNVIHTCSIFKQSGFLRAGIQNNISIHIHTYPVWVKHPHSPLGSFAAILPEAVACVYPGNTSGRTNQAMQKQELHVTHVGIEWSWHIPQVTFTFIHS